MGNAILTVIALVLSCVIGVWKLFSRRNEYKRKQAEQAKKELDEAKKNKDTSGITAAVDDINQL